jgi:MFS family permease
VPAGAEDHAIARRVAAHLPFFYGWVVVFLGFLGVFMMGATTFWAIPVFIGPMEEDTGWSRGAIFGALTTRFIVGAFFGMLLGRLADTREGPPRLLFFGVLIDGACMASLFFVQTSWQLILVYGVLGGSGNTGMRLVQSTLISKWFVWKRSMAIGFSSIGGGVSALVMVPITEALIGAVGWRETWVILAVMLVVVLLPMVPLAVRAPEDLDLQPDNGELPKPGARQRVSAATERSFTLREATHTLRFWVLLLGIVFGSYSLQTNTIIMKPYFDEIGFASAVSASALSLYGLFSIGARFLWGYVSSRYSGRPALIMQSLATAVSVVLLLQVDSQAFLFVVTAYTGLMLGGFPILGQLLWPEFFGRAHIGSITGLVQFVTTLVGAMGPLIAGVVSDQTGSYESALYVLIVTWLACAAVVFAIRPEPVAASARDGLQEAIP